MNAASADLKMRRFLAIRAICLLPEFCIASVWYSGGACRAKLLYTHTAGPV